MTPMPIKDILFSNIVNYLEKHPEDASHMIQAVTVGVRNANELLMQRLGNTKNALTAALLLLSGASGRLDDRTRIAFLRQIGEAIDNQTINEIETKFLAELAAAEKGQTNGRFTRSKTKPRRRSRKA